MSGEDVVCAQTFSDSYRDSVELMGIAAEIERAPGVRRAGLVMGTPANLAVLDAAGLLAPEAQAARSNDLVLTIAADDEGAAQAALAQAAQMLAGGGKSGASQGSGVAERSAASTIAEGVAERPGANLALISTPGTYATAEALKALKRGLHVFLFSDNVPVADEIELKALALRKGLLVMGPDCGTAILDGVPLGFANAVRRGSIGVVAASGTGLQQVTCLIDQAGSGVSQAIGVGGHDLSEAVGGVMMLAGLERLAADESTTVIVLLSKPPAAAVTQRILATVGSVRQPVVVNFLGGDPDVVRAAGAHPARTLEEAADLALSLAAGVGASSAPSGPPEDLASGLVHGFVTGASQDAAFEKTAAAEAARGLIPGQHVIRGIYSGGTLAAETSVILSGLQPGISADIVDLGDDEYTVGRPHPMIDPRLRSEHILAAGEDPATAVILLDIVLGYGSHPDPAGALIPVIQRARAAAAAGGRTLPVVASVCGTAADPQGLDRQVNLLADAGVRVARSNAAAARLARRIAEIAAEGSDPHAAAEALDGVATAVPASVETAR
jgi:FdrA protein